MIEHDLAVLDTLQKLSSKCAGEEPRVKATITPEDSISDNGLGWLILDHAKVYIRSGALALKKERTVNGFICRFAMYPSLPQVGLFGYRLASKRGNR